jgi:hypothetical protein
MFLSSCHSSLWKNGFIFPRLSGSMAVRADGEDLPKLGMIQSQTLIKSGKNRQFISKYNSVKFNPFTPLKQLIPALFLPNPDRCKGNAPCPLLPPPLYRIARESASRFHPKTRDSIAA